jgi:hypothetical protein
VARLIRALLDTLERDKAGAGLAGSAADGAHVQAFASKVFSRADGKACALVALRQCRLS